MDISLEFLLTIGAGFIAYIIAPLIRNYISHLFNVRRSTSEKRQRLFEDYSKRYSDILSDLLLECGSFDNNFDESSPKQKKLALQFIMLLSEEFFLSQKKLIDEDIWVIWKSGIEYHFSKNYFQTAWIFACTQMDLEGDFSDLVSVNINSTLIPEAA